MAEYWEDHRANAPYESEEWAHTDRGWLFNEIGCIGHYLDYGPQHYRSPHEYCGKECTCRLGQPGNIHAVRFIRLDEHRVANTESRYFPTVGEAKEWIQRIKLPLLDLLKAEQS